MSFELLESLPHKTKVAFSIILALGFLLATNSVALAQWKEEKASAYSGHLRMKRAWFDARRADSDVMFQIGPEGSTRFHWTGTVPIADWSPPGSKLIMKRINGELLLTADVRDKTGAMVVQVIDNDWVVSPISCWDKNYKDNSLEVKDKSGRVVLKTVITNAGIQIEGEWWDEQRIGLPETAQQVDKSFTGIRMVRPYPYDPVKTGPVFINMWPSHDPSEPSIRELFEYPSRKHFGELKDSRRTWADQMFVLKVFE